MKEILEALEKITAKIDELEEANKHDQEQIVNLKSRIKERELQIQALKDSAKTYQVCIDTIEAANKKAEEALSSLYIAHISGGVTDADFQTFSQETGLALPEQEVEEVQPEAIAQTG